MRRMFVGLIALGVCTAAMAQNQQVPFKVAGIRHLGHSNGGNAAADTVYYENTNGPYYALATGYNVNAQHQGEENNWAPGPGAGVPVFINQMVFGMIDWQSQATDIYFRFWEDVIYDGQVFRNQVGPTFYIAMPSLAPNFIWIITVDLSGLPGGGLAFANGPPLDPAHGIPDDFMAEQFYFLPGTTNFVPIDGVQPGFAGGDLNGDGTSEGPQVGSSYDAFFMDVNLDYDCTYPGTINPGVPNEYYWFGGGSYAANHYYVLSNVSACNPCDMDCNGTVNLFDIQGFVDVLNGAAGCSACAGDTDANGTINLFDIQGFVDCLNAP